MKAITINGTKITFSERPKHRSVTSARGIMTTELMKLIDISNIDPSKNLSDFIQEKIVEDPTIAVQLAGLKDDLSIDQTIILSTGLEYTTLQELKDEMYADEFIDLYNKSKKALGGKTAEDFFSIYPTSTISEAEMKSLGM